MTYRKPDTSIHPTMWIALIALACALLVIGYLVWSIWPDDGAGIPDETEVVLVD